MSPATTARSTPQISNHSAIVLDENAARCAMAFDLAVGRCRSYDETRIDGGAFWQELLRLADWRFSQVKEDREYFTKGILPDGIKKQMNKPLTVPGIVNESTAVNHYDRGLQEIDEGIARLERERGQWPGREWEERMRGLMRERDTLEQMREIGLREQSLFPVIHGQ